MNSHPPTCTAGHLGGHAVYIRPGPPNIDDLSVSAPPLNKVRSLGQTRGSTGSEGVLFADMGWPHFERLDRTSTSSYIARWRVADRGTKIADGTPAWACHPTFTKINVRQGKKVTPIPEIVVGIPRWISLGPAQPHEPALNRPEYGSRGALDSLPLPPTSNSLPPRRAGAPVPPPRIPGPPQDVDGSTSHDSKPARPHRRALPFRFHQNGCLVTARSRRP